MLPPAHPTVLQKDMDHKLRFAIDNLDESIEALESYLEDCDEADFLLENSTAGRICDTMLVLVAEKALLESLLPRQSTNDPDKLN